MAEGPAIESNTFHHPFPFLGVVAEHHGCHEPATQHSKSVSHHIDQDRSEISKNFCIFLGSMDDDGGHARTVSSMHPSALCANYVQTLHFAQVQYLLPALIAKNALLGGTAATPSAPISRKH